MKNGERLYAVFKGHYRQFHKCRRQQITKNTMKEVQKVDPVSYYKIHYKISNLSCVSSFHRVVFVIQISLVQKCS